MISTSEISWFQRSLFLFIPVSIRPPRSDSISPISDAHPRILPQPPLWVRPQHTPNWFPSSCSILPSSAAQVAGGPQMPSMYTTWLKSWLLTAFCLGLPHDLAQNDPFPCTLSLALRPKGTPLGHPLNTIRLPLRPDSLQYHIGQGLVRSLLPLSLYQEHNRHAPSPKLVSLPTS